MITTLDRMPQQSTIAEFERKIEPFKINAKNSNTVNGVNQKIYISDAELENMKARVNFKTKLRVHIQ